MSRPSERTRAIVQLLPPPSSAPIKQFPMLPWYPANFFASTRGWPLVAKGLYRELLDVQWEQGSLPASAPELRELIGATAQDWRHWPRVEPKFPIGADGRRRNARLESHRAKAARKAEKAAEAAREKWRQERDRQQGEAGANHAVA